MKPRTIIVYGPPACGKTRNSLKMAKHFGVDLIVDDWDEHRHELQPGGLHLTHNCPDVVRAECFRFDDLQFGNVESNTARRAAPIFKKRFSSSRRQKGAAK